MACSVGASRMGCLTMLNGPTIRPWSLVLIEEIEAVHNLADILTVDNIDVFFVAPSDLSQTMGHMAMPPILRCRRSSTKRWRKLSPLAAPLGLVNDDTVERYLAAGVRFFMTGWTNWVAQGTERIYRRSRPRAKIEDGV